MRVGHPAKLACADYEAQQSGANTGDVRRRHEEGGRSAGHVVESEARPMAKLAAPTTNTPMYTSRPAAVANRGTAHKGPRRPGAFQ
jgi:hypothetical protein